VIIVVGLDYQLNKNKGECEMIERKERPCKSCGEDDKSEFNKQKLGHEGLQARCKKCIKDKYRPNKVKLDRKKKLDSNIIATKKTRPCKSCGETDKSKFEKRKNGHEGLGSVCMKCRYKQRKDNMKNKETFVIIDESMSYLQLLLASKKLDPLKVKNLKTDVLKEIYALQNFDKVEFFKKDMFKINENVFWSFKSHQWNFGGKARMRKKKANLFDLYSSELPKTSNTIGLDSTLWFGKHCGVMVIDVWEKNRGYIDWLVAETEYSFSRSFLNRYDREAEDESKKAVERAKTKAEEKEKAEAKEIKEVVEAIVEKPKVEAVEELEVEPKVVIVDPVEEEEETLIEESKPIKIDVNVRVDEKRLSFFQWITYWF